MHPSSMEIELHFVGHTIGNSAVSLQTIEPKFGVPAKSCSLLNTAASICSISPWPVAFLYYT